MLKYIHIDESTNYSLQKITGTETLDELMLVKSSAKDVFEMMDKATTYDDTSFVILLHAIVEQKIKETSILIATEGKRKPIHSLKFAAMRLRDTHIISDKLYKKIELYCHIRNTFAHSMLDIDLRHVGIKNACLELYTDLKELIITTMITQGNLAFDFYTDANQYEYNLINRQEGSHISIMLPEAHDNDGKGINARDAFEYSSFLFALLALSLKSKDRHTNETHDEQ